MRNASLSRANVMHTFKMLRFKAKKVTPNQLFREKSPLPPKAIFSAKAFFTSKVQKYNFLGKQCWIHENDPQKS